MRRFGEAKQKTVLPRFISPRLIAGLWILLALFLACGVLAWLARIPVYASGTAIVVDRQASAEYAREGLVVAAFLPPENLPRLRAGQTTFLQLKSGERLRRQIISVEPQVSSPAAAQQRFALANGVATSVVAQPSAVALVQLEPLAAGAQASSYVGSVGRVDVETGTRRVISLLPVIGRFFSE